MKNVDGTFIDYAQFFFPSRKFEEKENAAPYREHRWHWARGRLSLLWIVMKLQYMRLDSALNLWPPGHFEIGFLASRIGRSEMECSALGFSYARWKPRNGQLAKMGSFHYSRRSDNKWYAVEVRWGIFIENLKYFFIP